MRILNPAVLAALVSLLGASAARAQSSPAFGSCTAFETGSYRTTEDGREIWRQVSAECGPEGRFYADEVESQPKTSVVIARGRVTVHQPDVSLTADRAEFDRKTGYGTFFNATGSARVGEERMERSLFGTLEPDVEFWGQRIERVGPRRYRITRGGMTTCAQPTRRWEFGASGATVALDQYALLRNAVLRVKGVPLLYVPVIYYPLGDEDRSTGFLLPSYSTSNLRGTGLSNAFFWAIARNQDATFFHDFFSKSGQGFGSEYRYVASPGSRGDLRFYMLDETAQLATDGSAFARPAARSYSLRGNANQELPGGWRLLGQADYFSNITTQRLYQQDVYQLSQHQRSFSGSLAGTFKRRYRFSATGDLREAYSGLDTASRWGRAPAVSLSLSDTRLSRSGPLSRVYVGTGGEAAYLLHQDDTSKPETSRSLLRVHSDSRIRASLSSLTWLSVTPQATWRFTHWRESQVPLTDEQVPVPLSRGLVDLQANVGGPSFSRVFLRPEGKYADALKHLIEPAVNIRWTSTFDRFDDVVRLDHIDSIVGGTTQIAYSVTNRLLARRPGPTKGSPGMAREILTVDVRQTYYSNARASSFDWQYHSNVPGAVRPNPFSPIQVNVNARPTDAANAQLSLEIDSRYRALRSMSASTFSSAGRLFIRAGWHKRFVVEELEGFDDPRFATHYVYADTTVRSRQNRVGGTYGFNLDLLNRRWVQQRIVAYYNAQCCGISIDYQSRGIPAAFGTTRAERTFGISFTLAGIGSFSNPLGSFGGGDRR
jgi:LPS-assembly protein